MTRLSACVRVLLISTVLLSMLAYRGAAASEQTVSFDIAPSRADVALNVFAQQSGVQLLYPYDEVTNIQLRGLKGRYSIAQGLERLLRGSCFSAQVTDKGRWAVSRIKTTRLNKNKRGSSMSATNCRKKGVVSLFASAVLSALLPVSISNAEESKAKSSASVLMEEVVVTARKKARTEAIQDVPIAMNAFGGEQIEAMFAETLSDIGTRSPNVQLEAQGTIPTVASFFIRGMGVTDSIPSTDSAVGTFVDGVYLGIPWGTVTDVFDLESVEVLRGPQGTLFGRNVTGGAVLLNSRMPTGEFGLRAKLTVGSHERADAMFSIEDGLTDNIAGKLGVLYKSHGAYYENIAPGGDDVGENDTLVIRPIVSFDVNDKLSLDLITEYGRQRPDAPGVQLLPSSQATYGLQLDDFEVALDFTPRYDIDWWHSILKANWEVGNGVVKSTTAYRELDVSGGSLDVDGTPFFLFHALPNDPDSALKQDQFSQEIVYAFSLNEQVDITSGLFYFDQSYTNRERWEFTRPIAFTDPAFGVIDHKTMGAFLQADIQLSDRLTTTLGGRYSHEEKDAEIIAHLAGSLCPFAPTLPGCNFKGSEDWSNFSPKVGLQYQLSDDVQTYASWTRGFRSGGFNVRTTSPETTPGPYDEETVEAIEVGLKSTLMDGKVVLNLAAFNNEFEDLQRTVISASVGGEALQQRVLNAASATINGVEMDLVAAITDNFVVTAALGYLDAEYGAFNGLDVDGDDIPDPAAAADLKLAHVPEFTYSLSATYDHYTQPGLLTFRTGYSWIDERFNDDRNSFVLEDYGLLDASVSFTTHDDRWKVSLFGKNLTDEESASNGFALSFSSYRYLNPPKTYGVEIDYQF